MRNIPLLSLLKQLANSLPADALSTSPSVCYAYGIDNSQRQHLPQVVVWPASEAEVVAVVKAAAATGTPLYTRGRGTATTGASLAERGGVVLSTERMAKVVAIDAVTRTATVQPGVLNGELAEQLAQQGLFWPPDPSSAAYCSVGGNLATAAAGPRGLRYGGARENTLAVRAVCGDGRVIVSGARTPKAVAGYDLARLLVGSEGTLAVITEATLRLWPVPATSGGCVGVYADDLAALAAIRRLLETELMLTAAEFLDSGCVQLIRADCPDLAPDGRALLLIALDAADADSLAADLQVAQQALKQGALDVSVAAPGSGAWQMRKVLSQHLRRKAVHKVNEDVVVPVPALFELVRIANQAAARAGVANLNFGHAGVGNLHVNFLYNDEVDDVDKKVEQAVIEVMEFVVSVGGSVSGEHGIGIAKRDYLALQVDSQTMELFGAIKQAFDPENILNPGKITPG